MTHSQDGIIFITFNAGGDFNEGSKLYQNFMEESFKKS
jgi:hypothetical protein